MKKDVVPVCFSLPPCCLLQEEPTPCYAKMSGATVKLLFSYSVCMIVTVKFAVGAYMAKCSYRGLNSAHILILS